MPPRDPDQTAPQPSTSLTRRRLLAGSAGVLAASAMSMSPPASARVGSRSAPGQLRQRLSLPDGLQSGDVTSRSAVLWARSSDEGRLVARIGTGRRARVVRGPWATPDGDHTARLELHGLESGREHEATMWFESRDGTRGETGRLTFVTADRSPSATSFVWTGDTAGQGWGINPDLGGMTAYAAMAATRPDFFVHAGDTVYSDNPILERVVEPDGQVWRNEVRFGVEKVAESLREFRGRHRYNLSDAHVRDFYARTPVVAQWDDHETVNNWWPGEVLDDERYTERRVDVLAARARRAWHEYQPVPLDTRRGRGRTGFADGRIYRKVERGRHLDVFCLDMRTYRGENTPNLERRRTPLLGREQAEWLVREVRRSRATWKVISSDMPLGLVIPDGDAQEAVANGDDGVPLGREREVAAVLRGLRGVPGVLWITADVHYCAAHHYSPEQAAYTDFDPFWEVVAGPIHAGTFGPNQLDGTFGPQQVFAKVADRPNQSPRAGNQFFGHVDIARDGALVVSLRDARGDVLWSRALDPR